MWLIREIRAAVICLIACFILKTPCFKLVEKNEKNEKAYEKSEEKKKKGMMLRKPLSKHEKKGKEKKGIFFKEKCLPLFFLCE